MEITPITKLQTHCIFSFYSFYINLSERKVVGNKERLKIPAKEFDILQILIEKKGNIATKEEILERIWSDSFVEEGNIPVHISKLRKILGSIETEPIIETISGTGYRLIPKIREVSEKEWDEVCLNELGNSQEQIAETFLTKSIAVLPLKNESNNDEIEYLADGLTESFINSLSRETELKVMSRNAVFRYKNSSEDAKEIGKQLGVETVLTGRIRLVSDRLILSIELIKVSDNSQIWGTQVNRQFSDIFEIQEKIISEISQTLVSQVVSKPKTSHIKSIHGNQESYREYLKGKYLLLSETEENLCKAITYFQASLVFNPENLYSTIGLIEGYMGLYRKDIISYTEVMITIIPIYEKLSDKNYSLSELEEVKGLFTNRCKYDFEKAENHYQASISLNRYNISARWRYASLFLHLGRFSEALSEVQKIIEIDRFHPTTNRFLASIFICMNNPERAIPLLKEELEFNPSYQTFGLLGLAQNLTGEHHSALKSFQKSHEITETFEIFALIGQTHVFLGRKDLALKILDELKVESKKKYIPSTYKAYIYLAFNDLDKVFECLEEAYSQRVCDVIAMKTAPYWIPIRKDPRFIDLMKRIGLPD
jgi:TolB-like protein/tetratricopeptide (TPR) repeat protein